MPNNLSKKGKKEENAKNVRNAVSFHYDENDKETDDEMNISSAVHNNNNNGDNNDKKENNHINNNNNDDNYDNNYDDNCGRYFYLDSVSWCKTSWGRARVYILVRNDSNR